jgi:hypothetical protein
MIETTLEFLQHLFPIVPEPSKILIWHLQNKESHWLSDAESASHLVFDLLARTRLATDLYVGCALAEDCGPDARTKNLTAQWVPGLWADLDWGPGSKPRPRDASECADFIKSLPLEPTLIVNSGHGYHCWWLYNDLLDVRTTDQRSHAQSVACGWQSLLARMAHERHWIFDSVSDFARVLRIPGTQNCKRPLAIEQVELLDGARPRYGDSVFLQWAEVEKNIHPNESVDQGRQDVKSVYVDLGAEMPIEKFNIAYENIENFRLAYDRQRKQGDQSASAYDLVLANVAVGLGWADDEITGLLVGHRRKHGDEIKRSGYFATTIKTARTGINALAGQIAALPSTEAEAKIATITPIAQKIGTTKPTKRPEPQDENFLREYDLRAVSYAIDPDGVDMDQDRPFSRNVRRVFKTISRKTNYSIEYMNGTSEPHELSIGPIEYVTSPKKFRERVLEETGRAPLIARKSWPRIEEAITRLAQSDQVEIGRVATLDGCALTWLKLYLSDSPPVDGADGGSEGGYPLYSGQSVAVYGPHFRKWGITSSATGPQTANEIGAHFKSIGGQVKIMIWPGTSVKEERWIFDLAILRDHGVLA